MNICAASESAGLVWGKHQRAQIVALHQLISFARKRDDRHTHLAQVLIGSVKARRFVHHKDATQRLTDVTDVCFDDDFTLGVLPDRASITDCVAFYAQAMDHCFADGETAAPADWMWLGGWVVSTTVGPFIAPSVRLSRNFRARTK
jgi:hypothetical protein